MKSRIYKLLYMPRRLHAPFFLDEIGWMIRHATSYSKCLDRPFVCIAFNQDKYDISRPSQAHISFLAPGTVTKSSPNFRDEIFFSFPAECTPRIWDFFNVAKSRYDFWFTPEVIHVKNLLQESLERLSEPGIGDDLDMLANLFITLCMRQAQRSEKVNAPIDNKIIEIASALRKGENLDFLLKKYSLGRRTFYNYWKKHFSVSPRDYKNEEQFQEAKLLLEQTGLPIKEIAENCAFSSPIYFSLYFRKHVGVSPKEYRRRLQNVAPPDQAK